MQIIVYTIKRAHGLITVHSIGIHSAALYVELCLFWTCQSVIVSLSSTFRPSDLTHKWVNTSGVWLAAPHVTQTAGRFRLPDVVHPSSSYFQLKFAKPDFFFSRQNSSHGRPVAWMPCSPRNSIRGGSEAMLTWSLLSQLLLTHCSGLSQASLSWALLKFLSFASLSRQTLNRWPLGMRVLSVSDRLLEEELLRGSGAALFSLSAPFTLAKRKV